MRKFMCKQKSKLIVQNERNCTEKKRNHVERL